MYAFTGKAIVNQIVELRLLTVVSEDKGQFEANSTYTYNKVVVEDVNGQRYQATLINDETLAEQTWYPVDFFEEHPMSKRGFL